MRKQKKTKTMDLGRLDITRETQEVNRLLDEYLALLNGAASRQKNNK